MRIPILVLLASAALLSCSKAPPPATPAVAAYVPPKPEAPTQSAPICARPLEKAAFDVTGLKSQLMVTAISCQAQDKYNAFVMRYRGDLVGEEKALNAYFGRAYGKQAQRQHDDYITQLANAQSQMGIRQGSEFCRATLGMFDDVMALNNSQQDLPHFAAAKPIQQSLAVEPCPDTPATHTAEVSKPVSKPKKKTTGG